MLIKGTSHSLTTGILGAFLAVATVSGQTDFGDEFEDGDIAVNAALNGSGFEDGFILQGPHQSASVTEVDDHAVFDTFGNTAGSWIISNDTFDPDGFSTTWSWTDWATPGGRLVVGLSQDPSATYSPGFQIDGTNGTDQIRVEMQGSSRGNRLEVTHVNNNVRTVFENVGSLNTLVDFSLPFDVTFSVTATGYEVQVDQGGSTVVGPLIGNWVGVSLADVEDASGEMRVMAYVQGTFQTNSSARLNSIGEAEVHCTIGGDRTGDGIVDIDDLLDFLAAWFAGTP